MTVTDLKQGAYASPWTYFLDICAVPRPSKYEAKIQAWLREVAATNGWHCKSDAIGNIMISVPGTGDLRDAAPLILQGHMDMVCEKNADVEHDFFNDPILPEVDGEWLTSGKTTLGADNGVALAYGLALAGETLDHRLPLELFFTIDEETGLTGALEMDASLLKGRHVLNLDSEDHDEFIIGCAGGLDLTTEFPVTSISSDGEVVCLSVSGLRGGHSGISIHENRDNAILIAAEILRAWRSAGLLCSIIEINGGSKRNAIPREASALLRVSDVAEAGRLAEEVVGRYTANEPAIAFELFESESCQRQGVSQGVLDFFEGFPNGVIEMEPDIPGLVRTSCSLGVAVTAEAGLSLTANARSSSTDEKYEVGRSVEILATQYGGCCIASGAYPGWEPHCGAQIVSRAADIYASIFGKPPVIRGIHAGLEAGIIGDILNTRELLAFGPLIENAHSPEERLNISSFERCYDFLIQVVGTPLTD